MAISPEDNIRQMIAVPKTTAKPKTTPKSSVPVTPVNQNLPTPEPDTRQIGKLTPEQYPKKEIVTNSGEKVTVYTSGPLAGQIVGKEGIYAVQANSDVSPEAAAGGTIGGGAGGGSGAGGAAGAGTSIGTSQDNTERQSAYDLLYSQFKKYGLESLVDPLKNLITDAGVSPAEFTIRLRDTDQYKKRFAANAERIKQGLTALNEAEYLGLEDQYQSLMRNYGLPASYYAKGDLGRQEGFEKLIANDVSASELEDRIATAQQRVLNANPEVLNAIKNFYGDSITNGDILAYALDPSKALNDIKKKVTAAEIQGAANVFGLNKITAESTPEQIKALEARANALAGYGVDKAAAEKGFAAVAEVAPRGSELSAIYKQEPYTQATAESEVFGTSGAAEAKKKRQKLTALEQAQFSGSSGVGALDRDKALYGGMQGQAGLY